MIRITEAEREAAHKSLTEAILMLKTHLETVGNEEAWPLFTGTPSIVAAKLLEWGALKGERAEVLLMMAAGIGYAHAKSQENASEQS